MRAALQRRCSCVCNCNKKTARWARVSYPSVCVCVCESVSLCVIQSFFSSLLLSASMIIIILYTYTKYNIMRALQHRLYGLQRIFIYCIPSPNRPCTLSILVLPWYISRACVCVRVCVCVCVSVDPRRTPVAVGKKK